jgi:hypothetical protein
MPACIFVPAGSELPLVQNTDGAVGTETVVTNGPVLQAGKSKGLLALMNKGTSQ